MPELRVRCVALGGEASELGVDAYLNGATALPAFQLDMSAHAVNERLDEFAPPKVPSSGAFDPHDVLLEYPCDGGHDEPA